MMEKNRIAWIDLLKLTGIIAIFCGHLHSGDGTERLYNFVFLYHVPLFFFVSGLFADRLESLTFSEAFLKKCKQLLLPYSFLVILSMIVIVLTTPKDFITYLKYLKQFIWGIRNQMPASSLWFFSCLFVMSIFFDLLRRLLKRRSFLAAASFILYLLSCTVFPHNPSVQPSWFFNIDSACHYMIYYALGYSLSSFLKKEVICRKKWQKLLVMASAVLLACYLVMVYTDEDFLGHLFFALPFADYLYPIVRAMLIISFHIILARSLADSIPSFARMGQETLWLCGNEMIVKKILLAAAGTVNLQITITDALSAVLYAVIMTLFILKVLLPVEKKCYAKYTEYITISQKQQ